MTFFIAFIKKLYNKLMGVPDNLLTNSTKVAQTNYWAQDKVIFSGTSTFNVTNTVSATPQTFDVPKTNTGGEQGLPVGIFSTDGGTTWVDMGATVNSSLTHAISKPAVIVVPNDFSDIIRFKVTVNSTVGGGGTFSLICSYLDLAFDNSSLGSNWMAHLPIIASGTNKTANTNITPTKLPVAYRQVVGNSAAWNPIASPATTTVPHGLGYVPDMMFWIQNGFQLGVGTVDLSGIDYNQVNGKGIGNPLMYMDATNIYYSTWNIASTYIWRLYKP